MATTWNPADKSANITLSNGDLTATNAGLGDSVRSVYGTASGKWYWEITVHSSNIATHTGVGDSGISLTGNSPGENADGYVYESRWGYKGNSGIWDSFGDTFGAGDIISVALDLNAGKIWFGKNGVWQASGDPTAGTNEAFSGIIGTFYGILYFQDALSATANFGNVAFSYSIPSGFNAGLGPQTVDADVTLPMATAEGFTGIYSAPSIPMATAEGFTGIYSAPSFPMIRANGTLSDNMVHIQSDVTIPSMTAEVTQAKQIWGAATAPMMTAEITERETVLGAVTVPMMTAELSSGAHADIEATAPMMTAAGLFSGRCAVSIPMMTAELEGTVGRVGDISVQLPMMTVSVTGKTEHLGDISVTVPMMLALAELITGKVITGAITLPMMTAVLSSYEDISGDITVSVPMMAPYMVGTPARFTCSTILRYTEPV